MVSTAHCSRRAGRSVRSGCAVARELTVVKLVPLPPRCAITSRTHSAQPTESARKSSNRSGWGGCEAAQSLDAVYPIRVCKQEVLITLGGIFEVLNLS